MLKSKSKTKLIKVLNIAQFVVPHAKVVFEFLVCVGKCALKFTGKKFSIGTKSLKLHMSSETLYGA